MRTLADIWLIWTVAAVTLVAAKCLQTRWYARQLEKRELEEERRVRRAYQRIYEDLNVRLFPDVGHAYTPRVTAFQTPEGIAWHVRASCEGEAAEILSQSFRREVA
jgi:hypothetical protein